MEQVNDDGPFRHFFDVEHRGNVPLRKMRFRSMFTALVPHVPDFWAGRASWTKEVVIRKVRFYDRDNEEFASIILSDPERYAGLPLEWARLWMERQGPKPAIKAAEAAKEETCR